jgi:hypothetical protein
VPEPTDNALRRLRTTTFAAGTRLRRGRKHAHSSAVGFVPALGDTRFAPLDGVGHLYVAGTTFAALLESAFHDAAPPAPRIAEAQLRLWAEDAVILAGEVRLIDLRDPALARLGIARAHLVATSAAHYPCTRVWAQVLHGRHVGGHPTHGLLWHSRQAELHAQALVRRPALRDLIDEHPAEVTIVWSPPAPQDLFIPAPHGLGPLDAGAGRRYVDDLAALLGIMSQ